MKLHFTNAVAALLGGFTVAVSPIEVLALPPIKTFSCDQDGRKANITWSLDEGYKLEMFYGDQVINLGTVPKSAADMKRHATALCRSNSLTLR